MESKFSVTSLINTLVTLLHCGIFDPVIHLVSGRVQSLNAVLLNFISIHTIVHTMYYDWIDTIRTCRYIHIYTGKDMTITFCICFSTA